MNESTPASLTPFQHGFAIGKALILGLIFGILGLVFGILSFVAGVVIEGIKLLFKPATIGYVGSLVVVGAIFKYGFNYAAIAAFPFFTPVSYLQALVLVVLIRILFKPTINITKGETLSEQERLLLNLLRNSPAAAGGGRPTPPGGPARNDTPRREAYRPQSAVPNAP